MFRALLLVLLASAAFAAEEAVPTHLKVKATFTRPDKDGKPEVYAEPSVITVDGKQTTIRVGSADEGVVFTVTPKVNKDVGRDHWPHAMSILMAGGGCPRGAVVGATDAKGYAASEAVYRPEDFAASIYWKLGIDPNQILHTNTGRPVQLVNNGRRIREIFAA